MKHNGLKIALLSVSLLLGSCTNTAVSSAAISSAAGSSATVSSVSSVSESTAASSTLTSSTATSSSETPASSSTTTSSTESSETPASSSTDVRSNYGTFSVEKTTNGADPVYDEATNTWTLAVSAKKATYTLSGYFKGRIVVANPSALTSYKGVILILNNVYIEGTSSDSYAVEDTNDDKYMALETVEGTTNYVTNVFGAVASENNLRFGGAGVLNLYSENGHGAKANDILLYGSGNINVAAKADGLHGDNFYTNDGETTPSEFTGTLTVKGVEEQALDFSKGSGTTEDPWLGSLTIDADAKIVVDTAQNVIKANTSVIVNGSIIATHILGDSPIITLNTGALTVTVADSAVFTCNGVAIVSETL